MLWRRRTDTVLVGEMEITAHSMLSVMVCGAIERMCEAVRICLMSVIGRFDGTGTLLVPGESDS